MKVELNAQMQISVQKQNITAYVCIPLNSIYSEKDPTVFVCSYRRELIY